MTALLEEALALHEAGISIIPIHPYGPHGDKKPAVTWKPYQTERASRTQVEAWFKGSEHGIGVICGTISGDLLMVEIEAAATPRIHELTTTAADLDLTPLWRRVTDGWLEHTPSGGWHWFMYCPGNTSGNRRLARTTDHKVLAETRENGGYSVVAPTTGAFHATGQPWTRRTGGPATAATLTPGELDDFLSIFRTLDEAPQHAALSHIPTAPHDPRDGITPGDDYENRTPWSEILTGWTPVQQRGTATMWRRPGKNHGISASTGAAEDRDRLYVWTTSTEFEPETPYTKFGAYCVAPETKILTADLRWIEAGDVQTGDELVGVDEFPTAKHGRRKLRVATVEASERRILPCYEIKLNNGKTVVSTDEHPWLASSAGKGGNMRWVQTKNLLPGQRISTLIKDTWETATDFDSGWLAGMYDGEGWASGGSVGLSQKQGPILDRAEKLLTERGFTPLRRIRPENNIGNLKINNIGESVELLGSLRPSRLIDKRHWVGRGAWTQAAPNATVKSIRFVGDREVAAFMTDTRTFIAEGLVSHNTVLEHGGDHHAAAKHLADRGFGKQAEHPRDTSGLDAFIEKLTREATEKPAMTVAAAVAVTPDETAHVFNLDISEPDTYTRTDDGNALRFVDEYHTNVRWIPENSTWAAWNGYKWDSENGNAVSVELARNLARNLPTDEKADETHKRKSLSRSGVVNMLSLAQTDRRVYAPLPTFDADPFMLNTPAGPVDLHTGELHAPDPSRRLLRSTTIAPDPSMPTPRWDQFVAQTFTNDRELIQYTQRLLGVALIGKVHQQILPFFHGAGANGKSTMLNVIQHILGIGEGGYTSTVPADIFLASAGNRHPADIASLAGTRIAVTSETEEGQRFAEARVKLLTGSDNISARFMHGNYFTFTPTHTFFLLSNHEPEVSSGGTAFWRRVRKLPFLNIVPEADRDPHLETKLLEEGPGILAWMIQGTRDYLARGMEEPEAVRVATKEYELDQDSIAQFVSDQCTTGDPNSPSLQTLVSVFRDSYDRWCRANAMEPIHQNHIGGKLRRFGVETRKGSKGIRYYHGIAIAPEWDTSRSDDAATESAWDDLGGGR